MTCINRFHRNVKAQLLPAYAMIMVLLIVLLQGCANTNENEDLSVKQTPETLGEISKELTDLVAVPTANTKFSTEEQATLAAIQSKRNHYLEQKQERLATVPAHVTQKYKQALALMKKREWRNAELLFDQVLVIQPQLSGAYVNKALIAMQQEDVSRASKQLNQALTVNPINPYAYELKGRIARLEGHFEQAEKSYLKALDIWPDYPEAQVNLAILLELYRGRLLDAHKYYSSYLALQADDQQVQRWLAGVEIKIKRAGLVLPEKADGNLSSSTINTKPGES